MLNLISALTIIAYSLLYAKYYYILALIPFMAYYWIRAIIKVELEMNHSALRGKILRQWNDDKFFTIIRITLNLTRILLPLYIIYQVTNKYFGILAN